jgi:hypothetical protein
MTGFMLQMQSVWTDVSLPGNYLIHKMINICGDTAVNNRKLLNGNIQSVPKRCIHKVNILYYNVYTSFWDTLYIHTTVILHKQLHYFCTVYLKKTRDE